MKKLNNKGFTLIEIVIVIVIIAILAAMLVPSLTQWIDKSKMKTFTSACGSIKTSAASYVAEQYATDGTKDTIKDASKFVKAISDDIGGKSVAYESATAGSGSPTYTISNYTYSTDTITISDGNFTGTSSNGGAWTVTKSSN